MLAHLFIKEISKEFRLFRGDKINIYLIYWFSESFDNFHLFDSSLKIPNTNTSTSKQCICWILRLGSVYFVLLLPLFCLCWNLVLSTSCDVRAVNIGRCWYHFSREAISVVYRQAHECVNDKHFGILPLHCLQPVEILSVHVICLIRQQFALYAPKSETNRRSMYSAAKSIP